MSRDYVVIGSTPPDEPCLQVGTPECTPAAQRAECQRYIAHLRKFFGPEPEGAELRTMRNSHDFGDYYEVVCYFEEDNQRAVEYAFTCEGDGPMTWDDEGPYQWP